MKHFLKSNYFKMIMPLVILLLGIALWNKGYAFGQWLHDVLN